MEAENKLLLGGGVASLEITVMVIPSEGDLETLGTGGGEGVASIDVSSKCSFGDDIGKGMVEETELLNIISRSVGSFIVTHTCIKLVMLHHAK